MIHFGRWTFEPVTLTVVILLAVLYVRGWHRLRTAVPSLASPLRLAALFLALSLLLIVTVSPLYWWSQLLLSARAVQKILIAMLIPALLWLSAPLHHAAYGLPHRARARISRLLFAPRAESRPPAFLMRPIFAVMAFLSAFLLWHEPVIVNATLSNGVAHLAAIWSLLAVAVLYWFHIVDAGPRAVVSYSAWAAAAFLLAAEIPNMASGITIAFTGRPLYAHYVAVRATMPPIGLTPIEDQMVAGAIIWVVGSIVYVSSIVLVVNIVFKREGGEQPVSRYTWDVDEKFIAPGLEHRVDDSEYPRPNWGE